MTKNRKFNEIAMKRLHKAFSGKRLDHAIYVVKYCIDDDYIMFNMLISKMLKACELKEKIRCLESKLIRTYRYNNSLIPWVTYIHMMDIVYK